MRRLSVVMRNRYWSWRRNLPEAGGWREVFHDCPPPRWCEGDGIEIEAERLIWPGRRGADLPEAPDGAHICKPFYGIAFDAVRIVVLGQDPYTRVTEATGRAFEDGEDKSPTRRKIGPSLGRLGLFAYEGDCKARCRDFPNVGRTARLRRHFDRLAGDGLMSINTAWTYSGPLEGVNWGHSPKAGHQQAHRGIWASVMEHLIRRLCDRDNSPLFLALGGGATALLERCQVSNEAQVHFPHVAGRQLKGKEIARDAEQNPLTLLNNRLPADQRINWRWQEPDPEA